VKSPDVHKETTVGLLGLLYRSSPPFASRHTRIDRFALIMSSEDRESSRGDSLPGDKLAATHVERIATHDKVPGHSDYYEKNGLRTYGDGEGE